MSSPPRPLGWALAALVALGPSLASCRRGAAPRHHRAPARAHPTRMNEPEFLDQFARTYRFRLGVPASVRVTPRGDAVLFLRSEPRSFVRSLYTLDPATGEERVLATAASILQGAEETLSPEERARRERQRLTARGIAAFSLSRDGASVLVPLSGRLFLIDRATGSVRELPSEHGPALDARLSPDGSSLAAVRSGELYALDLASGREIQLTEGGTENVTHGLAEFVAQEEMDRDEGFWWSPDGRTLAFQETDNTAVDRLHLADPMKPEVSPEASAYPRAGRANASVRLGLVPSTGGEVTWVRWDRERYPYLASVRWSRGGPLTLLVQNRAQTEELLLAADASGETTTLLTERDEAWLNLDPSMPRWLPDGSGFLWSTERDGAWRVELRAPDGALVRALTEPSLGYRGLVHLDARGRAFYVAAGEEPTESFVYRVSLDAAGDAPVRVTTEPGEHSVVFGEDTDLQVRRLQSLTVEDDWSLHRGGARVATLRTAAERPPFEPRVELATVGPRGFRAALVRPRDFSPSRRYPVVVSVYGGPHARVVTSARHAYLFAQWLADQGFVVVSLDGRGTPDRGRAWERALRGRLGDVPLEDQVEGLRALGARFPELDLTRVGIYGWSFGGYLSALAVMLRPDVFHVAVAGAPVSEWRDYDTHYTERYLGLPDEAREAYDRASLLTHAPSLQRPLLVVHGTADDNVYFTHSLKLTDALFRAGRDCDFLPLPGFTHMVPDPLVTTRLYTRIARYLQSHLGAPRE